MLKRVCFVGHRNIGYGPIKERLENAIKQEIENGCRFFTMGTHGEFDSIVLGICKQLRNTFKDIEIEVVLTSLQTIKQQVVEDEFDKEIYVPYSDVKTIMYEIEEEHYKRQITISNRKMIDTCDTIICYVDKNKSPSGAKTAMNYAKKKGLTIVNLYHEEDNPTFGMTKELKGEYWENMFKKI